MILKKKLKRGGRSFQNAKGVWVVPKMKKAKVNIQTSFFTTIYKTNIKSGFSLQPFIGQEKGLYFLVGI